MYWKKKERCIEKREIYNESEKANDFGTKFKCYNIIYFEMEKVTKSAITFSFMGSSTFLHCVGAGAIYIPIGAIVNTK